MKLSRAQLFVCAFFLVWQVDASADLREAQLRRSAIKQGLIPAEQMNQNLPVHLQSIGKQLFESELLSLNSDTSCRTCHLDRFSSADGLPNAIGVGGKGEGMERLQSGGLVVPRNTQSLWGRGSDGFTTFFWDGKVRIENKALVSQFGNAVPSNSALEVAVHLPFAEIREMVVDTPEIVDQYQYENVASARLLYERLLERVKSEPMLADGLAKALGKPVHSLVFSDVVKAIASFITVEFRIRSTKLHRFVFESDTLSKDEIAGGLIFYGKGRCSLCHNGPMFSDQKFYAIPFPQLGFGKNGFGIDYGKYNTSLDADDLYKFRTPPLYNVHFTAPYSHSGAVAELSAAVVYHFDPLRYFKSDNGDAYARTEFYKRLSVWSRAGIDFPHLTDREVGFVVKFLRTLEFTPKAN